MWQDPGTVGKEEEKRINVSVLLKLSLPLSLLVSGRCDQSSLSFSPSKRDTFHSSLGLRPLTQPGDGLGIASGELQSLERDIGMRPDGKNVVQ